jgi:type II secretory pathway pseudopilin PulG
LGVLVAISIPIFTSQLEKAREATDAANIRSQYAEVMAEAITDGGNVSGKDLFGAVELKQKKDEWQSTGLKENLEGVYQKVEGDYPKAGGTAWVEYKDDQVILHYEGGSGSSGSGNAGGGSTGGGSDSGRSTGGGSTSGGTGGGSGSLENPDEINSSTQLPNAFNSSINDWDGIVRENPSYTIVPGMVYSHQGSIYFGTSNTLVKNDQYTKQTPEEVVNWNALAKYSGKIWGESDFTTYRTDVNRGDLCKIGNDYYVYKVGKNQSLNTTDGPTKAGWNWQKINLNE